jgi:hypothetical protein
MNEFEEHCDKIFKEHDIPQEFHKMIISLAIENGHGDDEIFSEVKSLSIELAPCIEKYGERQWLEGQRSMLLT